MNHFQRIPLYVASAYFLIASGAAFNDIHTRVFDRGHSEMAGLVTYLLTVPSSLLVDELFTRAGRPIGSTDAAFVLYCLSSVALNTGLVFLLASAIRRALTRS